MRCWRRSAARCHGPRGLFPCKPETLLRWHRQLIACGTALLYEHVTFLVRDGRVTGFIVA